MTNPAFKVLTPGPLSLLQDGGRHGYRRLGLTAGGPLDQLSCDWANRLCGNRAGTPAVEVTMGGLKLQALTATRIAVTGALADIRINRRSAQGWRTHHLSRGDRLEIGKARQGCRLYLAVAGGFLAPQRFGSVATVMRERLGGVDGTGSPLVTGDVLYYTEVAGDRCFSLPQERRPSIGGETRLRMIPCLDSRGSLQAAKRLFLNQVYKVSVLSDRMGYRLEGQGAPLLSPAAPMLSTGLALGTVQLPPDGKPIVLLHDHQTIGGYPRLGVVASADLRLLAQLRPGETVRFAPITPDGALSLARKQRRSYEATSPLPCDPQA